MLHKTVRKEETACLSITKRFKAIIDYKTEALEQLVKHKISPYLHTFLTHKIKQWKIGDNKGRILKYFSVSNKPFGLVFKTVISPFLFSLTYC